MDNALDEAMLGPNTKMQTNNELHAVDAMETHDQSTDIPEATDGIANPPTGVHPASESGAQTMTLESDTPGGNLTHPVPATTTLNDSNVPAHKTDAQDMSLESDTPGGNLTSPVSETLTIDVNNATDIRRSQRVRKQVMNINVDDIGECDDPADPNYE